MPPLVGPPLGLRLTRTARMVSRAFDDALAAVGGSLPIWLVLISLKAQRSANQRQMAEAIGIQGATLTHHLNAMEADGLITRRRDPKNRRVHVVELTQAGEALFQRLRAAAVAFDRQLRAGLSDEEVATFARVLDRLRDNVAGHDASQRGRAATTTKVVAGRRTDTSRARRRSAPLPGWDISFQATPRRG